MAKDTVTIRGEALHTLKPCTVYTGTSDNDNGQYVFIKARTEVILFSQENGGISHLVDDAWIFINMSCIRPLGQGDSFAYQVN